MSYRHEPHLGILKRSSPIHTGHNDYYKQLLTTKRISKAILKLKFFQVNPVETYPKKFRIHITRSLHFSSFYQHRQNGQNRSILE